VNIGIRNDPELKELLHGTISGGGEDFSICGLSIPLIHCLVPWQILLTISGYVPKPWTPPSSKISPKNKKVQKKRRVEKQSSGSSYDD
jgi:hypothetical protein